MCGARNLISTALSTWSSRAATLNEARPPARAATNNADFLRQDRDAAAPFQQLSMARRTVHLMASRRTSSLDCAAATVHRPRPNRAGRGTRRCGVAHLKGKTSFRRIDAQSVPGPSGRSS